MTSSRLSARRGGHDLAVDTLSLAGKPVEEARRVVDFPSGFCERLALFCGEDRRKGILAAAQQRCRGPKYASSLGRRGRAPCRQGRVSSVQGCHDIVPRRIRHITDDPARCRVDNVEAPSADRTAPVSPDQQMAVSMRVTGIQRSGHVTSAQLFGDESLVQCRELGQRPDFEIWTGGCSRLRRRRSRAPPLSTTSPVDPHRCKANRFGRDDVMKDALCGVQHLASLDAKRLFEVRDRVPEIAHVSVCTSRCLGRDHAIERDTQTFIASGKRRVIDVREDDQLVVLLQVLERRRTVGKSWPPPY